MISSIRNIVTATLVISFLALSFTFAAVFATRCTSAADCSAVITLYRENFTLSRSTPQVDTTFDFDDIVGAVQIVSAYGLLFSIIVLVALETAELHYLRAVFSAKRKPKYQRIK